MDDLPAEYQFSVGIAEHRLTILDGGTPEVKGYAE
jgi:hypothetical protein